MKQFTIILFLFSLIIIPSQAQRGWRLFSKIGLGWVNATHESRDGTLWVGTGKRWFDIPVGVSGGGGGLWRYDGSGWESVDEVTGKVYAIHGSSDGSLWIGGSGGLWHYDDSGWESVEGIGQVFSICESRDGMFWLGTGNRGLRRYDDSGLESVDGVTSWVTTIYESSDGSLWAGGGGGLWHYDGSGWESVEGIGQVLSIYESSDSRLWVGGVDGMWYYDDSGWESVDGVTGWTYAIHESKDGTLWIGGLDGLRDYGNSGWGKLVVGMTDRVFAIHESRDGNLWIGGIDGMWYYDDSGWESVDEVTGQVAAIHGSSDGSLWVGGSGGLWRYDDSGWESVDGITGQVAAIHESRNGTLWLGTRMGLSGGLWRYDDNSLESVDGVTGWIYAIHESRDGSLWVGGHGRLWRYDDSGLESVVAVTGQVFYAVHESRNGTLWVGGSEGLWRYDDSNKESVDGVGQVFSIYESRNGTLWVGGLDGLWCKKGSGKNEVWFHFDLVDYNLRQGLLNSQVRAISESKDESLWVGGDGGLTKFSPNSNPPNVDIVSVDEHLITEISSGYVTGRPTLAFKWTAWDLETLTNHIRYQYNIDDQEWIPTRIQQLNTSFLNDGKHTFFLRALDYDGNPSQIATFDFTIDTIRPTVLVSSPADNAIVGGTVQIRGSVTDNDLSEFLVEYALGDAPSNGDFEPIGKSDQVVVSGLLAEWNAQSLPEAVYTIRLRAKDELEHEKDYIVTARLDKTPPKTELTNPRDNSRLTRQTEIKGLVADQHLDRYVLEYTTDAGPESARWEQVVQKTDLLQMQTIEDVIDRNWEIPSTISGRLYIRLIAFDAAGNQTSQLASVEVPEALAAKAGGEISSSDGSAFLYVPPNSLAQDTILTINRVTNPSLMDGILLAYQLEPSILKLNSIKPFTLTISYRSIGLTLGKEPTIFRQVDNSDQWQRIGGSTNAERQTVSTVINQLGRYGVMEMTPVQADSLAQLLKGSLTCQPRVFSPRGNTFNTETTISFNLDKPAAATVKVYNVAGHLVRLLAYDRIVSEGSNALAWNGMDNNNEIVPTGAYIVSVTVGDRTETKVVSVYSR